jgi:hypothetical protein
MRIIDETALDASINSTSFTASSDGWFALDIVANDGDSDDLKGDLKFQHRADPDEDFEDLSAYSFNAGPDESAFRFVESFDGAYAEYRLVFTCTSGTGNLRASIRNSRP